MKTTRRTIKERLNSIAESCDDDDYKLVDILINWYAETI